MAEEELNRNLLRAIVILPGTALVLVPALVLWATAGTRFSGTIAGPGQWSFWLSIPLVSLGLVFAAWTARLFARHGDGTPAPWDPPRKLVVRGPYRHVRNPMITGVMAILAAEALLFQSWPVAGWLLVFLAVNAIYLPLFEERGLARRFGDEYVVYKSNVPRWWPRLTPWRQP